MRYIQFKRLLIACILLLSIDLVYAQDDVQYNNYIACQGLLNPAYNGTRDVMSGLLVIRKQWVGIEGSPLNQSLNVHGPIEGTDLGVGLAIYNDRIGFTNSSDILVAGSYKLKLDRIRFLSLGLQMGVSSFVYDKTKAVTSDYGDAVFEGNKISKIGFNVGCGGYFYADNYFAGLSIPRMFDNSYDADAEAFKNKFDFNSMTIYIYGGYVFDVQDYKVKPTLLFREVYGSPLQFDIGANVLLMDQLWLGLSYRSTSDAVILAEYQINRNFNVRYSFDYTINSISQYAKYGSHEICFQFDFSFNKRAGMRSIRYF